MSILNVLLVLFISLAACDGTEPADVRPTDAGLLDASASREDAMVSPVGPSLWLALRREDGSSVWAGVRFDALGSPDAVRAEWLIDQSDYVPGCTCAAGEVSVAGSGTELRVVGSIPVPIWKLALEPDADCSDVRYGLAYLDLMVDGNSGHGEFAWTARDEEFRTCAELQSSLSVLEQDLRTCQFEGLRDVWWCGRAPVEVRRLRGEETACEPTGHWFVPTNGVALENRSIWFSEFFVAQQDEGLVLLDQDRLAAARCGFSETCSADEASCMIVGGMSIWDEPDSLLPPPRCSDVLPTGMVFQASGPSPWVQFYRAAFDCEELGRQIGAGDELPPVLQPTSPQRVYRFLE